MNTEDRLVELEIKLTHQEHLADTLNRTVYEQARRIDQLEAMLRQLAERVRERLPAATNEKPPHY